MNLFEGGRRLTILCFAIASVGAGVADLRNPWLSATEATPPYAPTAVYMHYGSEVEWEVHATGYRSIDEVRGERSSYARSPDDRFWAPGALGEIAYSAKLAKARQVLTEKALDETFSFLKWTLIAAVVVYAVVSGIGWIVRGFMGIHAGMDEKPKG